MNFIVEKNITRPQIVEANQEQSFIVKYVKIAETPLASVSTKNEVDQISFI